MTPTTDLVFSARVRCSGEQHTVGFTPTGQFVMPHGWNDYHALKEIVGDGEEDGPGGNTGGVRSVRCFYVASQIRDFYAGVTLHKDGLFHQIPAALRPWLKAQAVVHRSRVKMAGADNGPRARAQRAKAQAKEKAYRALAVSPVTTESGHRVPNCGRTLLNYPLVQISKRQRISNSYRYRYHRVLGWLCRDPSTDTGWRIVVPDTCALPTSEDDLESLRPLAWPGQLPAYSHRSSLWINHFTNQETE